MAKSLKSKGRRTSASSAVALLLALALPACGSAKPPTPRPQPGVGLKQIGSFESPVYVTGAPGFPKLLFVVEQGGTVRVLRDGRELARPFLDIGDLISSGGERGLLSIAFPPDYKQQPPLLRLRHRSRRGTSGSTNSSAGARREPRGAPVAQSSRYPTRSTPITTAASSSSSATPLPRHRRRRLGRRPTEQRPEQGQPARQAAADRPAARQRQARRSTATACATPSASPSTR